jgi:hypothetical protein
MDSHIWLIMAKDEKKRWKSCAVRQSNIPSVHEFTYKPLEAGLWCLYVSKHDFKTDYLTYENIENVLREFLDLPITVTQIKKAFARGGKKIIKNGRGEGYKISNPGELYLRGLKKDEPLNVVYINPDKPRTATKTLEGLIKSIPKDTLLICDPYYGIKTLEVLETFAKYHKEVKFLTAKIGGGEKAATLARAVTDFKKEYGKKVEIKLFSANDLHDRYVITKDRFFIIGHGIKDLGSKESLIVVVEDRYGKDIRKNITSVFNQRWTKGSLL